MAKLELTIENFDKVCASIERRGGILQSDIQNALLLAVDYWHRNNHNPRYITQLYRAVANTRGLSATRLEAYIVDHVPVALAKVKGELKFTNDHESEMGDTKLGDMLKVTWVDYKRENDEKEFDVDAYLLTVAKKLRKNGIDLADAEAKLDAIAKGLDAKLAKAAGNAKTTTATG